MYIIEYFRDSVRVARTPWAARLDKTVQVAGRGLVRHRADCFRIIDEESGAEIESGTLDA